MNAYTPPSVDRIPSIERARQALLHGYSDREAVSDAVSPWVIQSWQRCLGVGLDPQGAAEFELVTTQVQRNTLEQSRHLIAAAQPALRKLTHTLSALQYVAILTDHQGIVVDVAGPVDPRDRRVTDIARVGIDLSESSVGTTAIGAALHEQRPVWIHRTEHFFRAHGSYSCAGAPVMGPDGLCVGMLDLTGVDRPERPELQHLVQQVGRDIEHAMVLAVPHRWEIRLAWTQLHPSDEGNALVGLDTEGWVVAANTFARSMLGGLLQPNSGRQNVHATEIFALPFGMLIDAAHRPNEPLDIPIWSGLRLSGAVCDVGSASTAHPRPANRTDYGAGTTGTVAAHGLKDVEFRLIHDAVTRARGNVSEAAKQLGISRATIYRKLNQTKKQI
jgi:sigma-54 dependent transcriptional regulator, acetoin dehydrogenase operon transcriptional activator AcoR